MLEEVKLQQLQQFINNYSHEELVWINGYLSGIVTGLKRNSSDSVKTGCSESSIPVKKIHLVFGTETGNSKKLATNLAGIAKSKGINLKLTDLGHYRLPELSKEEYLFIVISTQGEGEPPAPAKNFYNHIHENVLSLNNLHYSVLALGDSSYPMFCKTGEDVDTQLSKFGAKRVVPLTKCDADYEEDALQWFEKVVGFIEENKANNNHAGKSLRPDAKKQTGKKYYNGTILTNINLNDRGSNKQTNHIEIGTTEAIDYEPGDSIGIIPMNRKEVVDKIISLTGINETLTIETTKIETTVRELLTLHLSICYLLTTTIKKYAAIIKEDIPLTRMDLVDLLRIYPVKNAGQFSEVMKILVPISPRLYSISSSPAAHGENEVHITVAKNKFLEADEQKFGLCSEFLGDQPAGTQLNFYVHKVKNFKLPAADKDIIMIGPGTGVAPFRSFLAHRDATGANGRNWFFFGEQHFITDFLYQAEMQQHVETGVLSRIDLAFSRDQDEKVYVQHRLQQKADELYAWLENGASIYISGTKEPMSKEVENTLLDVIRDKGNKTNEEALAFLKKMKEEGRFEKDVY